jgi:hypothetical protein
MFGVLHGVCYLQTSRILMGCKTFGFRTTAGNQPARPHPHLGVAAGSCAVGRGEPQLGAGGRVSRLPLFAAVTGADQRGVAEDALSDIGADDGNSSRWLWRACRRCAACPRPDAAGADHHLLLHRGGHPPGMLGRPIGKLRERGIRALRQLI